MPLARQIRRAARSDPHLPELRDSRRMIRGWEAGEHALSERYRLLYAAAFGVTADDLFTGTAGTSASLDDWEATVMRLGGLPGSGLLSRC
jgi:hypothetical protein